MAKMDPEEVERRLKAEAEQEKAAEALRDRKMDDAFMGDFYDLFGVNPSDVAEFQKQAGAALKHDVEEAQRVIRKAKKQHDRGNRRKAKKTLEGSKAVKKVGKAAKEKKGGGCAVIAVLLLGLGAGALGSAVWGAAEIIGALSR